MKQNAKCDRTTNMYSIRNTTVYIPAHYTTYAQHFGLVTKVINKFSKTNYRDLNLGY